MITKTELSQAELIEVVRALFEYNKRSTSSISLVDENGTPIEGVRILVECDEPGLKIRVAPEECDHDSPQGTPEEVARFFSQVNVANGK